MTFSEKAEKPANSLKKDLVNFAFEADLESWRGRQDWDEDSDRQQKDYRNQSQKRMKSFSSSEV